MPSIVEGLNKPAGLTISEALGGEKGMPISEAVKEYSGGGGDGDVVIVLFDEEAESLIQFIHITKGTRIKVPLPENTPEEAKSVIMYMDYNGYISFKLKNHRYPTKYDHAVDCLPFDGDLMYTASKDVVLVVINQGAIPDIYVEFDPNGGRLDYEGDRYKEYDIGDDVFDLVGVIPPENKELLGWGYESDATTLIDFPFTAPDHPITIYAIYQDRPPQEAVA